MQEPSQGGSYQRDPVTGALTPLHQTAPADPALQSAAESTPELAPADSSQPEA